MMTTIGRLAHLYEKDPKARLDFDKKKYGTGQKLDFFLKKLEIIPLIDFSINNLEKHPEGYILNKIISHLPVDVIVSELGLDAALWTWYRNDNQRQGTQLIDGIGRLTKFNIELLERARLLSINYARKYDLQTVLKNYEILVKLSNGFCKSVDLDGILESCVKQSFNMSKNLNDYCLTPLFTNNNFGDGQEITWGKDENKGKIIGNKEFSIYLDANFGVALMYKGIPNAVLGLVLSDSETLMINQLQGVRPIVLDANGRPLKVIIDGKDIKKLASARGLFPIDYQRGLVKVAESIARDLEIPFMGIKSAYNNRWTRINDFDGTIHLDLEKALVCYDKVAERLGFTQREDRNWYLPVNVK